MNFDEPKLIGTVAEAGSGPGGSDSFGEGRRIKRTSSICPHCLIPVDAQVFERHGKVWMDKSCTRHGRFSALLSTDIDHYFESSVPSLPGVSCCGSSCAPSVAEPATPTSPDISPPTDSVQWTNHSCSILIEITERCNLSCPTCFAGSSPQHASMMSMVEFTRQVDQLVAGGKCGSDMIQLSGGEPTLHPQLFAMIDLLFQRGFGQVCVNSNGIKLSQPAFAERLADCARRSNGGYIFVYLQFDGFQNSTHATLRGRANLLDIKQRALDNCLANGIYVHPVMTLTQGINDHEVGRFVQLAVENPALKNVVIQPAMYSGRYDNPRRQDRITLADTVDLICTQFGVFSPRDFTPIPCSDPNCFAVAVAVRTANGLLPISRYFPRYESWSSDEARALINAFTDTIDGPQAISEAIRWLTSDGQINTVLKDLDDDGVDHLLDLLAETQADDNSIWDRLLTISIKPFMDAWTYDQDRIDQCCVHVLDKDGNPVSFCEYNAISRPRMGHTPETKLGREEVHA